MRKVFSYVTRVFTNNGKNGNLLGVVTDTAGLTGADMQNIAAYLGYSETSFVFFDTNKGDYRVRFFTPSSEIPFAGHPTIGTLYVLRSTGFVKKKKNYVQVIGARRIPLEYSSGGTIRMDQGKPKFGSKTDADITAKLLDLPSNSLAFPPRVVSTGFPILLVPLDTTARVGRVRLNNRLYDSLVAKGWPKCVMPFVITGRDTLFCRSFARAMGIEEDPATGGAAGPLASYASLLSAGNTGRFKILQGKSGKSRIDSWVKLESGRPVNVVIGGKCVMCKPRFARY